MRVARWITIGLLALSVCVSVAKGSNSVAGWSQGVNLHVRQAGAFLRGELAVPGPGLDLAIHDGRSFVPFPPGPALVFLPVVALVGERPLVAPGVCLALTFLSVATLLSILRRLDVPREQHGWLGMAFFLGSGYWFALSFSEGVWHSALIVAVTALLLAINESLGRARPVIIGAWLGLALLSRHFTVMSLPFLACLAYERRRHDRRPAGLTEIALLLLPIAAAAGVHLLFDWLRFGSPWETGYRFIPLDGYEMVRRSAFGLFSPAYIPVNLFHLLVQGFHVSFDSANQMTNPQPDWFGTSLPAASPFILLALWAPLRPTTKYAWAVVATMALAQSMYYVNGAGQLNWQRYALDYWPNLFILVVSGFQAEAKSRRLALWKGAITYSVGINAFVLVYFDVFAWFLRAWPQLFLPR